MSNIYFVFCVRRKGFVYQEGKIVKALSWPMTFLRPLRQRLTISGYTYTHSRTHAHAHTIHEKVYEDVSIGNGKAETMLCCLCTFGLLPVICFIVEQFPQLCLHTAEQIVFIGTLWDCVWECVCVLKRERAREAGVGYVWAAVFASPHILSILA